ncbi:MaoC/PaaZ C-terminal domain-containing protein [Microbacterium pseudoresistens]|uniref:Acyl dehydratase n=1 Tax=Microbacterium pseudoresistens TaxID=640634 RepID=A0A7Y9EUK9_9MICO|nr:MaoC/PaaZ C-terminal domain-containing protein [Microbacterium pseudoresistens]NYD54252.1 acyl dehydratase [Microbacterium pseudoresistens]
MNSLFFEDLEVDQSWISRARTVTEADVVGFAGLSGDFNPIHLDAESTKEGPFGERIAHGVLGIAMATGFLDALGLFATTMAAMLSIDDWQFRVPIRIGDTLRLRMTIEALRLTSKGENGVVRRRLELINQEDVVVQHGVITVLIRSRTSRDVRTRKDG